MSKQRTRDDGAPLVSMADRLTEDVVRAEARYHRACQRARVAAVVHGHGSLTHQHAATWARRLEERVDAARRDLVRYATLGDTNTTRA